MNSTTIFCVLALSCFPVALASIPSFGLQTADSNRSGLTDADFVINPDKGSVINTPTFRIRVADLANFPALAGTDVQTQITRVNVRAGQPFIPHYHPRATETLNVLRGKFRITFTFEGLNPRVVVNEVSAGESTVFPQGLPHSETCISAKNCMFLSVFSSADPGFVPVTL